MKPASRNALIRLGAEIIELGGNEPIRLDREPNAWLVETGRVEIFAISIAADSQGQRTHVATITAGNMLFGVQSRAQQSSKPAFLRRAEQQHTSALLAVGQPDTRLLRAPIQVVIELARDTAHIAEIRHAIERWLADLFAKVPRSAAPNRFESLAQGDELELDDEAVARSADGVVWVRHVRGESAFLGRPELPMKSTDFLLPISDETWLVSGGDVLVSCVGTENLVRSGSVWEGLARFNTLFLDYIDLVVLAARDEEGRRLEERQTLDQGTLGAASLDLASVLDDAGASVLPASGLHSVEKLDPLLAAASIVTRGFGITLRKPISAPRQVHQGHAVTSICNASHIRQRLVILRDDWWTHDNGPLLGLVWLEGKPDPDHRLLGVPVALMPTSATSYELINPATGERRPVDREVAETLEGEAFMFYPPLPKTEIGIVDLLRLAVRGRLPDILTIAAMGALSGLLALLVPILTGQIFGVVIPAAERSRLVQMAFALGAAALATFGFRLTRAIAILRLSGKLDGSVQAAVWDRLLSLPVDFFKRFSVGDLLQRSMGIDRIRSLLLGNVATSFLDGIFSVFSLGLLFYYSVPLALIAVAMVAILMLFTTLVVWLQVRYQRRLLALQGDLASLVFAFLNGIQKLRGAGAEARAFALWAGRFGDIRRLTLKVRHLANGQTAFNVVFAVATTMVLFAAMHFGEAIELTVSEFLAFAAAFGQFQAAALSLISLLSSVLTMIPLYERLDPVLKALPEVDEAKTEAGELSGDVELSHVSFRYDPKGPLILDDVSVRAEPGEFIALVGPSGSGKSTTLRLLLGFEKPEAGSIYFDGQDLPSLDVQSVRRQIGVVLQNGRPMSGDIFKNIVGNSNLGMTEAQEAAKMAGLDKDIAALPMGMHTIVSESGGGFSGGQVQRLMIARAIVHRPRILFFDEATSALDNHTQEIVSQSLERLKATRIVVAHRLSTIRNADRIYVMEKGRVTEHGTYEELMALGGTFQQLAARQIA